MSRNDFVSLFTEQELETLDSVAVWQRTGDFVCQRLTQLPIDKWDAQLVGLLWDLAGQECKTQVAQILANG